MRSNQLNGDGFRFELKPTIAGIGVDWIGFEGDDTFMSVPYLRSLELASPPDMTFWYLILYRGQEKIGKAYFQLKKFVTADSLRQKSDDGVFCKLSQVFKEQLGKIEIKVLVLGNLLLTGQHGYVWDRSKIDEVSFRKKVFKALEKVQKDKSHPNLKYDVILTKDFSEYNRIESDGGLYEFCIEPAMEIHLQKHWNSMDDYIQDLQSKYRVRIKRAYKKKGSIESRKLSLEEILKYSDKIYELYKNIAKQVAFNIVNLNPNYFYNLKNEMKGKFELVGCFDGDKMIAFYSYIDDGDNLEAYYVGFDPIYNKKNQIYLNMLYEFLGVAINLQKNKLSLSRTALEIKSSLGATPEVQYCYLKHNKKMMQLLLPTVMKYFTPQKEWIQRNPFKEVSPSLIVS